MVTVEIKVTHMKKSISSRNSRKPIKYTPDIAGKVEEFLRLTGSPMIAIENANIARSTYYKWKKTHPEFRDMISNALMDFKKITNKSRPDMFVKALDSIEKLIVPRKVKKVTKIRKRILNEESGEEVSLIEEKEIISEEIRDPSWSAIEKIIGTTELRKIVSNKLKSDSINLSDDIFQLILGVWVEQNDIGYNYDGNILSDQIDLLKIRSLQAVTQRAYDENTIGIDKYNRMVIEQSKAFSEIRNRVEQRDNKLGEGKSYMTIRDETVVLMQTMINILADVVNDTAIIRSDIAYEFVARVKNIKVQPPYFQRPINNLINGDNLNE